MPLTSGLLDVLLTFLQNELSVLEFIHAIVETFDRYFESVVSLITQSYILYQE